MKKYSLLVSLLCAVLCLFLLSACDRHVLNTEETPNSSSLAETEPTAEPTAVPTPEPTAEPTPEPTPAPEEESVSSDVQEEEDENALPAPEIGSEAFKAEFIQNPIDAQYVEEMEYAASVSTMIYACNTASESWKDQIDAVYMEILDTAETERAAEIKAEQEAWISAQNDELKLIREAVQSDDAMASVTVAENIMLYYRSRAIELCAALYELEGQLAFG